MWLVAMYLYVGVGYSYNAVLLFEYYKRSYRGGTDKGFWYGVAHGFFGGLYAPVIGVYRLGKWVVRYV